MEFKINGENPQLWRPSVEHLFSDAEQEKQAGYINSAQPEGAWKHRPASLSCCSFEVLQEYGNYVCSFAHSRAKVYLMPLGERYGRKVNSPILFFGGSRFGSRPGH
jgi:hypothetical protein